MSVLTKFGSQVETCLHCGEPYELDREYTELCPACLSGEAHAEAVKLAGQVKQLIAGTGPFEVLTIAERREQLRACGVFACVARNDADVRPVKLPTATMAARFGDAPPADVRDDLESRIELDEVPERWDGLD